MANRFLNNITINDAYTLPLADGTAGQAITTDGSGNLAFSTVDSDSALRIALRVKNVSGSTLSAGTLVRVAPTANPPSGNVLEVDVADNSAASTMPAVGILIASIADQAEGDAVAFGRASGFSTSGYTEGDPIWVGSNGAFVGTKPTGSDLIQKVGQIIKVHSSNGSIEVFGAGRTNDVPNLSVGKIWVGTTTNTAESTLVEIDETNNILTVGGKIYYSNVFDQEADLPSATTYHGMFAHVHGTGYAYYAHAGAWVKLAKHSELVAAANDATITLTAGTGLSGGGDFTTDQATNETITVNLADTAVTPGTYGDANNTPQITIDQQGRITSATTIPTAGAGGGSAGGSMSAEINQYTGNGTTDAFSLTTAATDDDAVQVYLDGVYQVKTTANYSISGSTVTFVDPPTSGTAIEFVHFIAAGYSTLNSNQFTGTGSQTDFTLTQAVDVDKSFVFIQGVYQEKSTYSISGTTLTFTTAPLSGYTIEVITVGSVSAFNDTLYLDNFNGTGSQVNYTLSTSPANENAIDVYINGLYQQKDTFSLSGSTLTFSAAPPNGSTIEVKSTGGLNNVAANITRNYSVAVISSDTTAVSDTLYVLTANLTLTLPASPSDGNSVKISNRSGVATCVIARNGENIMGAASDLTIDKLNSGFELIYAGSAQGWVLIGVEGTSA